MTTTAAAAVPAARPLAPAPDSLIAVVQPTPGGPLAVLLDGHVVVAAGFVVDPTSLRPRLEPGLRGRTVVAAAGGAMASDGVAAVTGALERWLDGDLHALDVVPTRQPGTAFRRAVWAALSEIPAGSTAPYGAIAAALGSPGATRAVGSACGANLIAPFVPCHRAVRADGSLGGYAYGLDVKRWLIGHERRGRPCA